MAFQPRAFAATVPAVAVFLYITKMTGKDALVFMKNNSQTTQKNADWSDVFVRTNIIRQIGVGVSVFPGIA